MMTRQAAAGRRILALVSILMVAWAGPAIGGMAELGRNAGDKGDGKGKVKNTLNPDFEVFSSICTDDLPAAVECDPNAASPCATGNCDPGTADQLLEVLKDKINADDRWTAVHRRCSGGTDDGKSCVLASDCAGVGICPAAKEISVTRGGQQVSMRLESTDVLIQHGKTASRDDFKGKTPAFIEVPRLGFCAGGNEDGKACADSSECSGGGACVVGTTIGAATVTVTVDANLPAIVATQNGWDGKKVLQEVATALDLVLGKEYRVQLIENGNRIKISGADSVEWDHTDLGITGFGLSSTGPPDHIPTLSVWGILLLVLLLGTAAMLVLRHRHRESEV